MRSQSRTTSVDNILPDLASSVGIAGARTGLENHVRDNQGPDYRVASGLNQRHLHVRMTIDHRFDFFRVNLEATDIDRSIPPPDEIVSIASQLDHVLRVYETIGLLDLVHHSS
jgi:hypothetical protein